MKQLLTAAAISITLLSAGCSSDSTPEPQTPTTPTTPTAPTPFDGGLVSNAGFDNGVEGWTGNAANAVDDGSGSNTVNFANVAVAGDAFNVNLSHPLAIEQGKTYTLSFKAKSDTSRTMLAGIGLNEAPFTNISQSVDLTAEWKTFTLTLAASNFGGTNSRVLFDMGAATGQVFIDDVSLVETEAVAPNFDSGLLSNGDFTNGVDGWIGNAASPQDDGSGSNIVNFANVEVAGDAFNVNLSQVVAIEQGMTYELKFKAKSNRNRTMLAGIGLNEAPFTNNSQSVDLTSELQDYSLVLSAGDFGGANSRVLFDMGADTGEVIIDNVSLKLVAAPFNDGLLTNGDFELGNANWLAGVDNATPASTIIDDNGNKIYSVNVESAGNPFEVNLSQKLAIEAGKIYKMNFKAKSDVARTITAGIGLSGAPFTNQVDNAIALTTEWQDFERTFTADFTAADSRVLFDMGAAVGLVQIDEVSLVEVVSGDGAALATIDFESPDTGADYLWAVFENNDNPALEIVTNPGSSEANASATVAKMIARAASTGAQPFAGVSTESLPTFTLGATNKVVKVMVYKSVISDVGVKFESLQADGTKASTGEIKVANTLINQWEELTFDFSSVVGEPANTDITGLVIFPDFTDGRAADSVTHFDNISFGQ